ncbi:MAG: 3-oxoacyl-ACP synthase [Bacteroidia bacterium]|nr:3-oxoacyl-ACP synthase [Bacteroidia bacterium]
MQKSGLAAHCRGLLEERINDINSELEALNESLQGETKSSAGDKHETSRAMMNLEQEKMRRQLHEAQTMRESFLKIDFNRTSTQAIPGSLIYTDQGVFLLSIGLGKVQYEGKEIILLSPASPLGSALLQRSSEEEEEAELNGKKYRIEKVV